MMGIHIHHLKLATLAIIGYELFRLRSFKKKQRSFLLVDFYYYRHKEIKPHASFVGSAHNAFNIRV